MMWGTKKPRPRRVPAPRESGFSGLSGEAAPRPSTEVNVMPMNESFQAPSAQDKIAARLGSSLRLKGEISGNEDLQVDGSVEGLIHLDERKLVIGASAKVSADIIAREVVVYGNVKGNLKARDRIEIKKDGSVVGDLTTARIMIEDGAYFKGSIEIDRGDSGSAAKPAVNHSGVPVTAG
jgi:cytoskeletal protein CcmA (bactofilin family)